MTDVQTTPDPAPPTPRKSRRGLWFGLGALVLVIAAGIAVWYFVFRDTAPPKVNIDSASNSVKEDSASSDSSSDDSSTSSLDGSWTVDNSIGDFDVSTDTFTSAFVGYRVNEELAGVGAKTAYGRTPDVSGSLTLDGTTVTAAEFTADLTTLKSDDARRDGQLSNQAIQTSQFPDATFKLTEPIELGTIPTDESTVSVDATGELTLHGVTKTVTIPLEAKLVNNTIVVTSLFDITFADFNITKPSSAAVLSVEDKGIMEVQLFFTKS